MSGLALNYRIEGSGSPVLLLHGMVGSHRYWNEVVPRLSPRHKVLAVDLLGFGHSPKPKEANYDLDDHIGSIVATIRASGLPTPLTLVGHSMGSLIALALAVRHPDLVSRLVLVSMPMYPSPAAARHSIVQGGLLPEAMLYGSTARAVCAIMCKTRPLARAVMPLYYRDLPPDVARDAVLHTWYSYSRSLKNILEKQDVPRLVEQLRVPAVLLIGTRDRLTEGYDPIQLDQVRRKIHIVQVDATHHLPLERPEEVVRAIEGH